MIRLKDSYKTLPGDIGEFGGGVRKGEFLADARRFCKAIGQVLHRLGYTEQKVSINPGGPAVSGEVYGHFQRPQSEQYIHVCITVSAFNLPPVRTIDNVAIIVQERWVTAKKGCRIGPNHWLSPNASSDEIAARLLNIIKDPAAQLIMFQPSLF